MTRSAICDVVAVLAAATHAVADVPKESVLSIPSASNAAPRKQGRNTQAWDGLDENGVPVPAGKYHWKLLATQGLAAEYLMSVCTNVTPTWESWPGNHGPACFVAVDDAGMYAATGRGEGTALV